MIILQQSNISILIKKLEIKETINSKILHSILKNNFADSKSQRDLPNLSMEQTRYWHEKNIYFQECVSDRIANSMMIIIGGKF